MKEKYVISIFEGPNGFVATIKTQDHLSDTTLVATTLPTAFHDLMERIAEYITSR